MKQLIVKQRLDRPWWNRQWGSGPWNNEPDRVEWHDESTSLACLAHRSHLGAWCGYVAVPPGHLWHGVNYEDIPAIVHGGLTYADFCDESESEGDRICHVPLDNEPADVWWLGFDCAHVADLVPLLAAQKANLGPLGPGIYRDLGYVRDQCRLLAAQIQQANEHAR